MVGLLLLILGAILVIFGVWELITGALLFAIILIVVGVLLLAASGAGHRGL